MYGVSNKKNSICKQNAYFINGKCAKANECKRNWWYKFKCLWIWNVQKCHSNGNGNKKFDLFYVHILHRCDKIHDVQPISIPYFSSRYVCIVHTQIDTFAYGSVRCHSSVFDPLFYYFDAHFSGNFLMCINSLILDVWHDWSLLCDPKNQF